MKTPQEPRNHVKLGGYAAKQCPEMLRKELDPSYPEAWKDEYDAFTLSIMGSGNHFEGEVVLPALEKAIRSNITIDTTKPMGPKRMATVLAEARTKTLVIFDGTREEKSKTLRETLTHALCEQPGKVRVLWNPRLRSWKKDGRSVEWMNRSAEPDLLYRQGTRTTAKPRWGSIDVKWHKAFTGARSDKTWKVSRLSSPYLHRASSEAHVGTPQKVDALQLSHYHRALEFHGLAGIPTGGVIGKAIDGQLKVVWVDLTEKLYQRRSIGALDMYDAKFDVALRVALREMDRIDDPTLEPLAGPEWKTECPTCVWRTTCHDELSVADHITLLPGITPSRAKAHYAAGVSEVAALAKLDTKTAQAIDAGASNLIPMIEAAATQPKTVAIDRLFSGRGGATQIAALRSAGVKTMADLAALDPATAAYGAEVNHLTEAIDKARVVDYARIRRMTHVFRARGVKTLEIPRAKVEIHVDMENDTHIYLWGVRVVRNNGAHSTWEHKSFVTFEATDAAEAKVTVEFWKFLMDAIRNANKEFGPGEVKIFHYTAAEDRCLRHLAEKHAGTKGIPTLAKLEAFLASDTWVDLYPILTNQLIWPTENMTLKSLAKYVRFFWRDEDPSGSNSVVWYQQAIDPTNPEAKDLKDRIVDYNADDCEATAVLLAWLQQFGKVKNLSRKLASVEDLEERYRRPANRKLAKVVA